MSGLVWFGLSLVWLSWALTCIRIDLGQSFTHSLNGKSVAHIVLGEKGYPSTSQVLSEKMALYNCKDPRIKRLCLGSGGGVSDMFLAFQTVLNWFHRLVCLSASGFNVI